MIGEAIERINSYQEFIDLLEQEREELKRRIEAPNADTLALIDMKKRLWAVKADIAAKRQYVEMYRKRAVKG